MTKVYIAIAFVVLLGALFKAGMMVGAAGVASDMKDQMIARQVRITTESLALSKRKIKLDEQSRKNEEVLRNVKDKTGCADTVMPKPLADILR